MKPSEKFKQAIKEGKIQDAFAIALGNAPQLKITSWIADPEAEGEPKKQPRSQECLRTHLNLIEGEIVNEIGEGAISDELYSTLQQFHLQRVAYSHQTVGENIQTLQQMFRLLTRLQKQQQGEPVSPLGSWQIVNNMPVETAAISTDLSPAFLPPNSFAGEDRSEEDIGDLLTLDELEQEPEPTANSESDGEDWGDLLDEEEQSGIQMIDLQQIDLSEDEEWESTEDADNNRT